MNEILFFYCLQLSQTLTLLLTEQNRSPLTSQITTIYLLCVVVEI
jgi:hypothetical protein